MIYCHHPEQLLVKKSDLIRRLLHFPIDRAENKGFKETNSILCNSNFTKSSIYEKFNRNRTIIFQGVDGLPFPLKKCPTSMWKPKELKIEMWIIKPQPDFCRFFSYILKIAQLTTTH